MSDSTMGTIFKRIYAKPSEAEEKELACAMASSNFTIGCKYDWIKDACECRGPVVSPIWRR